MKTIDRTVEEIMRTTNQDFETAFGRGDAAGLAAVYTADGQVLPPNGETVSGRTALQSFWQAVIDMGVRGVTLETKELEQADGMAYEIGRAILYGEGKQVLDTAKYLVIWKEEDGQWKWHRDIWNSDTPAAS